MSRSDALQPLLPQLASIRRLLARFNEQQLTNLLFVVRDAIALDRPDLGERLILNTGDQLDLPAGTLHNASVSPDGVA